MHPTVEEQLRAIRRLVDDVAAHGSLDADGVRRLALVSSQLRRLEANCAARLPFLLADNADAAATLASLGGVLPEVAGAAARISAGDAEPGEAEAHDRNTALRGLLARAVHELSDDDASAAARTRIAAHLRRRLAADPTLNRPDRTAAP
jgi:hypothetical protein